MPCYAKPTFQQVLTTQRRFTRVTYLNLRNQVYESTWSNKGYLSDVSVNCVNISFSQFNNYDNTYDDHNNNNNNNNIHNNDDKNNNKNNYIIYGKNVG